MCMNYKIMYMLNNRIIKVLVLDAIRPRFTRKTIFCPLMISKWATVLTACWWRYPMNISTGHIEIRISTGFVRERNFPLVTANNNNKFTVRLLRTVKINFLRTKLIIAQDDTLQDSVSGNSIIWRKKYRSLCAVFMIVIGLTCTWRQIVLGQLKGRW